MLQSASIPRGAKSRSARSPGLSASSQKPLQGMHELQLLDLFDRCKQHHAASMRWKMRPKLSAFGYIVGVADMLDHGRGGWYVGWRQGRRR